MINFVKRVNSVKYIYSFGRKFSKKNKLSILDFQINQEFYETDFHSIINVTFNAND